MAEFQAFQALRFTPGAGELSQLVCPPYDIISDGERKAFLERNPRNIIRLELPREGEDPYGEAGKVLRRWLEDGTLACDDTPGFYIYQEEFTVRGQRLKVAGLVGRVRLEPWEKGVVLPHEETLSGAKEDRLRLMKATGCNFSSIYSLYFDESGEIAGRIQENSRGEPLLSFQTADGIGHKVWKIEDEAEIAAVEKAFGEKKLYIADGHHRYETALNYRNHLKEQGVVTDGQHPANFIMMTVVSIEHPGLVVFPTHRIVRGLEQLDVDRLLDSCRAHFSVASIDREHAMDELERLAGEGKTAFALYDGAATYVLALTDRERMAQLLPDASKAYRGLDVSILHTLILEQQLGIDKENMKNQQNLTYTRDVAEAFTAVDRGEANCCFLINATRVEEIADVALAGEKMPQKSTYFYPKLITGHLMNKIR